MHVSLVKSYGFESHCLTFYRPIDMLSFFSFVSIVYFLILNIFFFVCVFFFIFFNILFFQFLYFKSFFLQIVFYFKIYMILKVHKIMSA